MWHIETKRVWYWGGKDVVERGYSYQNVLCRVFRAHVKVEVRKKCHALFKLLGMDGE